MLKLVLVIAGAFLPSLLLVFWFYRMDRSRPEPIGLIGRVVLLGFLGAVPAIALEIAVSIAGELGVRALAAILPLADGAIRLARVAWSAFVTAALVEESVKLAVVRLGVFRNKAFDEVMDGIVYAACASLGFAFAENILYGLKYEGSLLLRAFTAVPMHATAAGIMGFYIGRSVLDRHAPASGSGSPKRLIAKGLGAAVLVHGLYDFFLFWGGWWAVLALPTLGISMLALKSLVADAKELDAVRATLFEGVSATGESQGQDGKGF